MPRPLRVLIVEDSTSDADLIVRELRRAEFDPDWQRVDTEAEYEACLGPDLDIILADYRLPHFSGMRALELLRERGLNLPFILVSGAIGEDVAITAMKQGATDYLLKDRLARLGPAIERALEQKQSRLERNETKEALGLFRTLVDQSNDTFEVIDPETARFLDVNEKGPIELGCTRAEYLSLRVIDIDPMMTEQKWRQFIEKIRTAGSQSGEGLHRRKDGTLFPIEFNAKLVRLDRDYVVTVVRDTTERKRAEEKSALERAQFKLIFDTVPIGIAFHTVRPDGSVTRSINEAHLRICGLTRDLRDEPETYWNITHPDDRGIQTKFTDQVAAGEIKQFSMEKRYLHSDGKIVWVNFTYQREIYPDGTIEELTTVVDITERKCAEMALRESEEKYRQLVHALPSAVYTCDAHGRITLYNAAAVKLWGREPDIAHDRWCGSHRIFTPDGKRLAHSRCPMAISVKQGEPIRDAALIVERPDGSRAHVLAFPDPIYDSAGTVTGAVNMLVDITALKVAENALRTSERSLRTLSRTVEQSPTSVLVTTTSGAIDYANPKFTEVTGYSLEEVLGKNPRLLKSGVHGPEFYKDMWDTIVAGRDWKGEICNRKKNGELFWESAMIAPIHDEHGTVTHFVSLKEDITERRRATQALAESRQRLEGIVGSAMDAIISINDRQSIVLFNAAAEKMFRCSAQDAIGSSIDRFIPMRFQAAHAEHIHRFGETGVTNRAMSNLGAMSGVRTDGEEFPIEASISQIEVGGEKLLTITLRDITERKRLQSEILDISEFEQRRIGQDLHDDLCQHLAGLQLFSGMLARDLAAKSMPETNAAERITSQIRDCIERARMMARGLFPVTPNAGGLAAALQELAGNAAQLFHVKCECHTDGAVVLQDATAATHLYRIAQEAITNAVKHGHAKKIVIELTAPREACRLSITDDGTGFSMGNRGTEGMGLRTMKYRATMIGASLEVHSTANKGTTVICTIPTPNCAISN